MSYPPPPEPEPDVTDKESEPPSPKDKGEDWQVKYTKAEESRKNAHAPMTQTTQKAADLERSNTELQQQMALLQVKVDLISQQSTAQPNNEPESSDQFQELRKDYQELDPVFNKLDESEQLNRKLEQRLAAIEKARQEQEIEQARQAFWKKVRSLHPDVEQISSSEDFKGWFARQPADVQELNRLSPLGAAQVMSLHKEAAGLNKLTLYCSNNLATASGVTQCMAGVKDFAGFASQFIKHESLTLEKHFGMGHRGLQVYGYKVLKPDAGVLLAAKRS